jgi:S1-C subfamily serine protease
MEDLGCPRRRRPAKALLAWTLMVSTALSLAQPVAVSPQWLATFPAAAGGKPSQATAVPIQNGEALMVSVVTTGSDATRPTVRLGNNPVPVQIVGFDPVSRLGFFKATGSVVPKPIEWREDSGPAIGSSLRAITPAGTLNCRSTGWVKQVGRNILPLALLRVNFDRPVPNPGTPLLDDEGRVAAILFQDSGSGNTGYAIPAEAVHRVRRDICAGGRLVRGWLGLSLLAESQSPQVVRVLPNSPAAAAGIKKADVLLSVGSRQINDYADAANAFFYLVPGQPVRIKLLRGVDQLEFTLTPTKPQVK